MQRGGWCVVAAIVVGWGSVAGSISAAELSPSPKVPGFERFYAADETSLVDGGRLLISELNCTSCHKVEGDTDPLRDKQAPVLDLVGERARPEWIRSFLKQPHVTKPGTTMPDLLGGVPEGERDAAIEALTHFLASTGAVSDTAADPVAAKRGEALFNRVGCLACHDSQDDDAMPIATSVSLPHLSDKYSAHSLATFLKDPHKARPSGRMPALGLKDEEYRDLAAYFLRDRQLPPNVEFAAYHGDWDKLPNFDELKPVKTGQCAGFDLTVAGRANNFAIRFTTLMFLPKDGNYSFILGSDDGSRLLIDDKVVVDVDGIHPHQEKRERAALSAGQHRVVVEYFQGGGEWTVAADIEGNGLTRQSIASLCRLTETPPPTADEKPVFALNPELVPKGRELFASVGCANCHQMKANEERVASTKTAKSWKDLAKSGGCVAETPAAGLPNFHFTARQVAAITAAMSAASAEETPQQLVHRTLVTLNCYACHARGELKAAAVAATDADDELPKAPVFVGGVEEARNVFFKSSQPEMGDEGRIPPALTGVGDKLTDDWLKQVLDRGANDRQNYMQTRMPRFGDRNVGHLTAAFIAVDRQPDSAPQVTFDEPEYRVKSDGRHLVGAKALSCIKCHDFAQHPAQGVRAINLATMTKRLRPDWFHRYLLNPQDYRPGTRMPAPWPFGQTTIRDVLDANVDKQIQAVWTYLADGDKAAIPVGLVREPIELVATETPILYRNFIEGAGSRAIGVGYPEKVNLAWDANNMRLAMIWHGAFIDASRHWNGRGVGFEAPLGDHVLPLPDGPSLAALVSPNDPWPMTSEPARESGYHFKGYRLDAQQRPMFLFTVGEVSVTDNYQPLVKDGQKDPHLARTLTITGPASDQKWYVRALRADRIEPGDTAGSWKVDGIWTFSIAGPAVGELRDSQGQKELLIPVSLTGQPVEISLQYAW